MYRVLLYIILAFFFSLTFSVKAEKAYCAKYEECREARWTDLKQSLFEDIDLTSISVSLTINPTAWILYSMYIAVAEGRGYDLNKLSGTIQADILKEYVAQNVSYMEI